MTVAFYVTSSLTHYDVDAGVIVRIHDQIVCPGTLLRGKKFEKRRSIILSRLQPKEQFGKKLEISDDGRLPIL
jgi:hypothetical protein